MHYCTGSTGPVSTCLLFPVFGQFLNGRPCRSALSRIPRTGGEFVDPGFTSAQLAMVDISTDLINERDTEIRKIVETIAELAQIMRDLSTLVVEQGTMLDRIDHNIQQTSVKVGGGKEAGGNEARRGWGHGHGGRVQRYRGDRAAKGTGVARALSVASLMLLPIRRPLRL